MEVQKKHQLKLPPSKHSIINEKECTLVENKQNEKFLSKREKKLSTQSKTELAERAFPLKLIQNQNS